MVTRHGWLTGLAIALFLVVGCGTGQQPVFDDENLHFTPPAGWAERARSGGRTAHQTATQRPAPPLPPLGAAERQLVRYDRLTATNLAWLRVSAADPPAKVKLTECLSGPTESWRRNGEIETLEVAGEPAVLAMYLGRWDSQDYRNETVVVRRGGRVYLITASFPASDTQAQLQVRQAVAGATWK